MKKDVNLITKDFYIRYTWFKHMSWCELLLFTDSTFFLECFLQVLRQLAPDVSYRSLVMLGIASVEGLSVASFENDDAERLLFFCTKQGKVIHPNNSVLAVSPSWLMPPPPSRKRSEPCQETKPVTFSSLKRKNGDKRNGRQKMNIAAMRPIPHSHRQKMVPFSGISEPERLDGDQGKKNFPVAPAKHSMPGPTVVTHRKSSSFQAQQIISLNPLPLKKHGCGRSPIQVCLEVSHLVSSSKSVVRHCFPCHYWSGFIFHFLGLENHFLLKSHTHVKLLNVLKFYIKFIHWSKYCVIKLLLLSNVFLSGNK